MIVPDKIYFVDKDQDKYYFTIINEKLFYSVQNVYETYMQTGDIEHLLFKDSCMTHNFTPFMHKNKYYGIGGQDDWKCDKKWRDIDFETFKPMWEKHFQKKYKRGIDFYAAIKHKFDTTPVYSENRGLYLSESIDGITWNLVQDDPIITAYHPGFLTSLAWKSAEFDGKPTMIRYKGKWFLYLRANIDRDRRHIQVATSGDLKTWSDFELLNIDYDIKLDNYYHPIIIEHKHKLIGFFNYYNDDTCCVKIKKSEDGINWIDVKSIFESKSITMNNINNNNKIRNNVCGVEKKDDSIIIYLNYNYYGLDFDQACYIVRYKISEEKFDEWINKNATI